jgi:hypothetical protein
MIVIWQSLWSHHAFNSKDEAGFFCWLICMAAPGNLTVDVNGIPIRLQRGQICMSTRDMAAQYSWDRSRVWRLIQRLRSHDMIEWHETQAATQPPIITICNYNKYQNVHIIGETRDEAHPDEAGFDLWWTLYPRKVNKRSARAKYLGIVKRKEATHDKLYAGLEAYLSSREVAAGYVKHPDAWLNAGKWADATEPDGSVPRQQPEQHGRPTGSRLSAYAAAAARLAN